MIRRLLLGAFLASGGIASSTPAQDAPANDFPFFDHSADGTLWARGENYKMAFRPGSAEFTPCLGSKAPRNYPLRLALRSLRANEHELVAEGASTWRHDGASMTCDHGGVLERWTLRGREAEQDFVIASLAARGALALELAVETELAAVPRGDALEFLAPGLGGVAYGEALIFDAEGKSCRAPSRFEGGAVRIGVPASFVADAALPITIDPVIQSIALDTQVDLHGDPDVAYDATADVWLTVYAEGFSSNDRDIAVRRRSGDGTQLFQSFLDTSDIDTIHPRVANADQANRFLAVWQENGVIDADIKGRLIVPDTGGFGGLLTIGATATDDELPDVGGGGGAGTDEFLVAWVKRHAIGGDEILMRAVTSQATFFAIQTLDDDAGCSVDPQLTVSNSRDALGRWGVVYEHARSCGASPLTDIAFAYVNNGGNALFGPTLVSAATGRDRRPDVAALGRELVVIFDRQPASVSTQRDLFLAGFLVGASNVPALHVAPFNLSAAEPGTVAGSSQAGACIDTDGCRFTYAYNEDQSGDLFAATIRTPAGPGPLFHRGHEFVRQAVRARIAGAGAVGGDPVRYAIAAAESSSSGFDVQLYLFDAHGATGTAILQTSCNTGPASPFDIGVIGVPALGSAFRVTLGPARGTPFLVLGPPVPQPLDLPCFTPQGICRLGIPTFDVVLPGASFDLAVPCDLLLFGGSLGLQGIDLGTIGGCDASVFGIGFRVSDTAVITVQ